VPSESTPFSAERIEELLFAWQQQADRGPPPSLEEFCRDSPELAPELARRVRAVRWVEALLVRPEERPSETSGWSGSALPGGAPDEEAPPALPGYGPLEKVARGGMGDVYKARNLALGRVEAVKTIRTRGFAGPQELARFRFEAEAAARLTHPNIVTMHRVDEVDGRPYLAMQWIDGCSLANRPRDTPAAAAALLAKVARAVHYAHQRGILHRDLKPHNILVDATGEPYVADFGIARPLDRNVTVTEVCNPIGTPAYMSPEQTRCEPHLTVASDVFALGVVLYVRLTGSLPFGGANHFAVMEQVRVAAPVPPRARNADIDRDLEAVCLKCLEKDPQDRYSGADELADDLDRYCRGEAVTARPPGFWDWLRQLARTRPEPNPNYSWPVTVWFGAIALVMNVAVYALVRADGPAAGVWAANTFSTAGLTAVLWWYMLRKFRQLPPTERHSLIIAAGTIAVYLALTLAYVPLSLSAPARVALGMYPALAAVCGLGMFVLGSTNWSRFFPVGLGVIALVPVLARWPEAAPLVFGTTQAAVMWGWSYVKKVTFGRAARTNA